MLKLRYETWIRQQIGEMALHKDRHFTFVQSHIKNQLIGAGANTDRSIIEIQTLAKQQESILSKSQSFKFDSVIYFCHATLRIEGWLMKAFYSESLRLGIKQLQSVVSVLDAKIWNVFRNHTMCYIANIMEGKGFELETSTQCCKDVGRTQNLVNMEHACSEKPWELREWNSTDERGNSNTDSMEESTLSLNSM